MPTINVASFYHTLFYHREKARFVRKGKGRDQNYELVGTKQSALPTALQTDPFHSRQIIEILMGRCFL